MVQSAAHDQPVSKQHVAREKGNLASSLSQEAQTEQTKTGLISKGIASSTLQTQSSDSADDGRQAVFAEMGQKTERSMSLPTYLDEKHRTKAIGLAIVALTGQFLVQKNRHQTVLNQTCLIPPRRRGSIN
jgi:hypothetical protein